MAVRNTLECRYQAGTLSSNRRQLSARNGGGRSGDPIKALVDGTKANLEVSAMWRAISHLHMLESVFQSVQVSVCEQQITDIISP